jgi:uncharacterized membrane protein
MKPSARLQTAPQDAPPAAVVPAVAVRYGRLDALRGGAVVWMAVFHFCFDLNQLRLLTPIQAFTRDPYWTVQRACIVTLFVGCAGVSQALALQAGQPWSRFWRRWAQVAGCALAVTLGSALVFPQSFIYFGVLHGLALMLVLARLAAPLGRGLWLLGPVCLVLPWLVQHPIFDTRWTNWTGLITHKPVTEDYVPLLPWLGVMLMGLAAGQWLLQHRAGLLSGPVPGWLRPLAWLGRWSLSFYMAHQPVLMGGLLAGRALGCW